jgi:hypothetical protein
MVSSRRVTSRFLVYTAYTVAAAAARLQFSLYDLNQAPLLGVYELLVQVLRLGDQESFPVLCCRIVLVAIKLSDIPGVVRV